MHLRCCVLVYLVFSAAALRDGRAIARSAASETKYTQTLKPEMERSD